jgi:hypothetical protein
LEVQYLNVKLLFQTSWLFYDIVHYNFNTWKP